MSDALEPVLHLAQHPGNRNLVAVAGGGIAQIGIAERLRALRLSLDAFGRGSSLRDDVTFVGLEVD